MRYRIKTKRYTSTRIKRYISYIITNTKENEIENIQTIYPRVTGFDQKGKEYLNSIKKEVKYFTRLVNGINKTYDKELLLSKIFTNIYKEDFIKIEQQLPYKKTEAEELPIFN